MISRHDAFVVIFSDVFVFFFFVVVVFSPPPARANAVEDLLVGDAFSPAKSSLVFRRRNIFTDGWTRNAIALSMFFANATLLLDDDDVVVVVVSALVVAGAAGFIAVQAQ